MNEDERRRTHRRIGISIVAVIASLALAACATSAGVGSSTPVVAEPSPPRAPATIPVGAPRPSYLFFVAAEAVDRISLIRFTPGCADEPCARVERETKISLNPTELAGPHGLAVAPGGRHYYVTTAHGFPSGSLWKLTTDGDSVKGRVQLGAFPATLDISPDGAYAWAVNFNLHGDMEPSSVSVVYGDEMVEVARIPTCTMPHGSRLTADGAKHYSVCMMDDVLIEIDTRTMRVARHFMLRRGSEHGMPGAPRPHAAGGMSHGGGHEMSTPAAAGAGCSPTWAQPNTDGSRIYVACSKSSDVVEIDGTTWTLRRRIPMGEGVYNLALARDGRLLLGTNKRGQSVSIVDVASGKELARLPTRRRVPSGVALSGDDRYAFVTVEGVGSEPGTVEIIDLVALETVARIDVGQMAGGVAFWKAEEVR
jgi:DNA-binding beta-propeller fold protein YncE